MDWALDCKSSPLGEVGSIPTCLTKNLILLLFIFLQANSKLNFYWKKEMLAVFYSCSVAVTRVVWVHEIAGSIPVNYTNIQKVEN